MEKAKNPWSVPVLADDIEDTGMHIEIEAPDVARADLAKLAGLRELARLSATFDLVRRGAGVHVQGQVKAQVGQTCVVTLEPVESEIEEAIDLVFAPRGAETPNATPEIDHEPASENPPEPLIGGQLDLGAIATEFLLLGINPYPRKSGVEFTAPQADTEGARPFAALEALKRRLDGG